MLALGAATLDRIVDIDPFEIAAEVILPGRDLQSLRHEAALLSPDHVNFDTGTLLLGLHSFLLRVGGLTVLIDTCVGEHKPRPRRSEWHDRTATGYLRRLARAGVAPEDVDVVLCTHLHADHVGWNTRTENGRWEPTFPRARYLIGRAELDHWQAAEEGQPGQLNHGAFTDSVQPILDAGLAEQVEDGFALASGARITGLAGHAPGQIGLTLDCGAAGRALFCGDALHSPVHVFRPDWSTAFCHDPAAAARTRARLLDDAAEDGALILPAHLRNAWGLRIRRDGDGFRPILE